MARPTATFPATESHCQLTSTKLYCLVRYTVVTDHKSDVPTTETPNHPQIIS